MCIRDRSEISLATSNAADLDMLFGAVISPLYSWCATSFDILSAISLPSNLECPRIFISLMSMDRIESC